MKFYIDESASFLSTFDIEGLFLLSQAIPIRSRSLEDDTKQLMNDQKMLESDYKRACDRILEETKNKNG